MIILFIYLLPQEAQDMSVFQNDTSEHQHADVTIDERRKYTLLILLMALSAPVLIFFGSYNIVNGRYFDGMLNVVFVVVIIVNLMILHKKRSANVIVLSSRIVLFLLGCLLLQNISHGGAASSQTLWSYTFPLTTLFLLGKKEGMIWLAVFYVMIGVLFFYPDCPFPVSSYPFDFKLRFLMSSLLVTLMTFSFEMVRYSIQANLLESNQTLEETNERLRQEIVERAQVEEALCTAKKKAQQYLDIAGTLIVVIDSDQRVRLINKKGCGLLGYREDEIIGKNWCDLVLPERERERTKAVFSTLRAGKLESAEYVEHAIMTQTGEERLIAWQNAVVKDEEGTIVSTLSSGEDITERKRAEEALQKAYRALQNTQAQLIQSAKLASIGELAAGVAHELNQPLMVIRSTAQFVRRTLEKGKMDIDQLLKLFEPLERNTKRMMNIINHLRSFSRQSQTEFSPLDVNRVIEESFLMIGEQLRLHNIEVRQNLLSNLPHVRGDANQLEQVFLNLITNARDAIDAMGMNLLKS